jgi:hypothetical protein
MLFFPEYEALVRLGISDPHTFLRKHFPNEKLMLLSSCAVGAQLFEIVEAAVDEAIATGTFVDVMVSMGEHQTTRVTTANNLKIC